MRKQIAVILGILAISAALIFAASFYGNRNQFVFSEHLEDAVFTLDGREYSLHEMAYYIARQEYQIEEQAKIYDAEDTNKYWALHINGKFVRLRGKENAKDAAIHDMLLYMEAEKQGIVLDEEEKQYAENAASDLCYDLGEEQMERAELTEESIYEMTERAALAEKYQEMLAEENDRNFGAFDYSGTAYKEMLKEHELEVNEDLWEDVPFGNVAYNHRFESR